MAIPKLVQHKQDKHNDTNFTECARDNCNGKINQSDFLKSIKPAKYICRSCGATWKQAGSDAPKDSRGRRRSHYLVYVSNSCTEHDSVKDTEYRAKK